jgi:epoxyqueuosine reductase
MRDLDPAARSERLKREAATLGFDACGITNPQALGPAADRLRAFVEAGHHGTMTWMADTLDRRADPRVLWPDVRAIVMVGVNYAPPDDPLEGLARRERALVSVYAKGRDYHDVLKARLKALARWLAAETAADVKVFVDTAPVMEKPLAAAAGLGWQGKHTNLVSRQYGSWLFLGTLMTTVELAADAPEADHCGSCRRCLDICPTAAMPAPYRLDARRCLAYLSIEHKGHIPREFRRPMGNRVFGCDDCLAVCPWNKFAAASAEVAFAARPATDDPPIGELLSLDDATFRTRYAGTPVKRTGRDRVVRNALIAAGNSGERSLLPQVRALTGDGAPVVRAMAAWATSRLTSPEEFRAIRDDALRTEMDPDVRAEWEAGDAP